MAMASSAKSVILMRRCPPHPHSMLAISSCLSRYVLCCPPAPPFNVEKCCRVPAAPPGSTRNSTLNGGTGDSTTRTEKPRAWGVNIEWGYGGRAAFSAKARAGSVLCDFKLCSKNHIFRFPVWPYRKKSQKSGKSKARCLPRVVPSRSPFH